MTSSMVRRRVGWMLALGALVLLAGCALSTQAVRAQAGTLDLRGWDFQRDGIAELDGQWLLQWGRFEDPASTAVPGGQPVTVPGNWNAATADGKQAGPYGHGTYRLQVACNSADDLALNLPYQHSAARWFVNGIEVARQGEPGDSERSAKPGVVQQIAALPRTRCPLNIVVHVSNHELRRGGLARSVELGASSQLYQRREFALVRDVGVMGGLVVMGVMPLLFFLRRRQDTAPLFFGLFCLVFALSMGLSGTRVLQPLFAPLGWEGYLRVVFIGWCSINVLYALFVRALYPRDFGPRPAR